VASSGLAPAQCGADEPEDEEEHGSDPEQMDREAGTCEEKHQKQYQEQNHSFIPFVVLFALCV
jgi:hypothetical protein